MKPMIEVEGRRRSDVALLGVSVLPLHTSLSICNRDMFFTSIDERNAETFSTLPSKALCESIGGQCLRLFAEDITSENNKNIRIHPTNKCRGLSARRRL